VKTKKGNAELKPTSKDSSRSTDMEGERILPRAFGEKWAYVLSAGAGNRGNTWRRNGQKVFADQNKQTGEESRAFELKREKGSEKTRPRGGQIRRK